MPSKRTVIIVFALIFTAGVIAGGLEARRMLWEQGERLRAGAMHNAVGFPQRELALLTGTPSDIATPQYLQVLRNFEIMRKTHPAIEYASLLRFYPDTGHTVCLAAAGPAEDAARIPAAGASLDGTPDARAAAELAGDGTQTTVNLFHRDWKNKYWVSGYARCDENDMDGAPVDVFRYDVDANYWFVNIVEGGLAHLFAAWLLPGLPFAAFILGKRHRQRALQIIQFNEAVEQTETPIMIASRDGHIKYANLCFCKQAGYTFAELRGWPWRMLRSTKPPLETTVRQNAMLLEGITVDADWEFRRKDGTDFPAHVTATPIRNKTGGFFDIIFVVTDTTKQRRRAFLLQKQKESIEQEDHVKKLFLVAANHEMSKPLDDIGALSRELERESLTPEQAGHVTIIRKSGDSLARLTRDISDLSRIESGQLDIEPVPTDLRLLIRETLDIIRVKAGVRKITLLHKTAPDVPRNVIIAAGRLRQILLNLLENALKFTESGEIEVRLKLLPVNDPSAISPDIATFIKKAKSEGRISLLFSIRDTGIGISGEQQKKLFKPFWQADSGSARRYGGAGLGLSITQQLVQMLDGEIRAESQPGLGSTFHFSVTCTHLGKTSQEAPP